MVTSKHWRDPKPANSKAHGEQLDPLVDGDSGHGMLFRTFDGQLMLVLHHPFGRPTTRARLYDMEDTGDAVRVVRPALIWMVARAVRCWMNRFFPLISQTFIRFSSGIA